MTTVRCAQRAAARRLGAAVLLLVALSVTATPTSTDAAPSAAPAARTIVFTKKGTNWTLTRIGNLRRERGVMRLDAARKAFGTPSSVEFVEADEGSSGDPARCVLRWRRLGLGITFLPPNDLPPQRKRCPGLLEVTYVDLTRPVFQTDRGIRIGSSAQAAKRAYGLRDVDETVDHTALNEQLTIHFTDGRVDSLSIDVNRF